MWAISFPGLQEKPLRDIRIVLTALPSDWVVRETQDDIMSILVWSFQALSEGKCPQCCHNSEPWTSEDSWRKKRAGEKLHLAALIELKGDWKQLHGCFGVPYWRRAPEKPICWRCTCSKDALLTESGAGGGLHLKDRYRRCTQNATLDLLKKDSVLFGMASGFDFAPSGASWLQPEHRLSHYATLERLLEDGGSLSPAFGIPFFSTSALRIDWLHCADQGVTAVYLGGLFHMVLCDPTYGRSEETRCANLWHEIQGFYAQHHTKDRLHNLTVSMVKPTRGAIELRGSGAQIRALVPFALLLVAHGKSHWAQKNLLQELL